MVFSDTTHIDNEENTTDKPESHSLNNGNSGGYDDDDDSDTGSDEASDRINIMDGLSAEALAALLEFQLGGANDGDEDEDDDGNRTHTDMSPNNAETSAKFDKDTLCATYRPEDASRIAETLRRLHDRDHNKHQSHDTSTVSVHEHDDTIDDTSTTNEISVQPMSETILPQASDIDGGDDRIRHLVKVLQVDGVVRIDNVLSSKLCQECSNYIDRTLLEQDNIRSSSDRTNGVSPNNDIMFGNVFARDHRYDMYLHPGREMMISNILNVLLHPERSVLGQLFQVQLQQQQQPSIPPDSEQAKEIPEGEKEINNHSSSTEKTTTRSIGDDTCGNESPYSSTFVDAEFHELSSLISDPGSIAQPLHPDSPYYPAYAPLWTVFIALQDIKPDMGGTVVIPKTHTEEVHQLLRTGNGQHNIKSLLQSNKHQYRRADLNIGDCIVMDSRLFHYGGANHVSSNARRTLLYFTIRNPYHQARGYPDCNSLYPDLDGSLKLSRFFE